MVRIGELLLEQGSVDATNLRRALAEQALAGGKRICSLLIARGLLDPDEAARALGEQHDVPAVLQRHFEHRDRGLAAFLPAALARVHVAMPIGRTRSGDLIVAVRDPSREVQAAIRRAIEETVVFAIAPAAQLEHLIETSYEGSNENDFDVDLTTGTQLEPVGGSLFDSVPSMPEIGMMSLVGLDDVRVNKDHLASQVEYKLPQRTTPPPFNAVTPPFASISPPTQPPRTTLPPRNTSPPFGSVSSPFAAITPPTEPPRRDGHASPFAAATEIPRRDPPRDSSPFAAITPPTEPPRRDGHTIQPELEPEEIDRLEAEMSVPPPRPSMVDRPSITADPPAHMRPTGRVLIPPIGAPLPAGGSLRTPTNPIPYVRLSIGEVVDAIADAVSRDTATDVAMRFATQRWTASLLLAVKEGAALGHRGHGTQLSPDAVRAVAIPLTTPSIVKAVHDTKKIVTERPAGAGAIHERIERLLSRPRCAIAAPIMVGGRIACVFAVGDLNGPGDSAGDLESLATALGDAYTRILRDMK